MSHGLDPEVSKLLTSHGYVGEATRSAPRGEDLEKSLTYLINTAGLAPALGADLPQYLNTEAVSGREIAYHQKLPGDLPRAAPETYRSIRNEGVATLRAWVLEQYPASARSGLEFQHLFQSAVQGDFLLAQAKTETELNLILGTSDQLEIIMRDLGAHIYEKRTGDRSGASHMRALRTPGQQTDVLPDWLVSQGTLHSKSEHQRAERLHAARRQPNSSGETSKGKGKGKKGKGKKGDGKKGGAAAAPGAQQ